MSNMVVQTNVLALNSHRYMKQVGQAQSKSSARLSSGYKINSAADDAAGLAISEKMRAQIRGLDQASKNAQDGISLIQTAEGGMQEIDNMLQRIRELVVSVSNDTNENNTVGTGDRQKMQDEIDQLVAEIDSMSERVEFNKKKVINGSYADTALQLKNAKAEYDRSSLSKVETNAKLSAYKDALGVSDDTSNATGTTAYSRLNAAQDAVDAGVTPYKDALKAYTAAEVTYTEAQSAYQTTRQTMEDQLSKANLEAADITNAMLDKTNSAYISDDFARAFTAYQEASNTWGIEELGFDTTKVTAANVLTGKTFTGVASADQISLSGAVSAQDAYDDALAAAAANTQAAEYLAADPNGALKAAYDTAKADLVAAMGGDETAEITSFNITSNAKLETALKAYVEASNAYGVDEIDLTTKDYYDDIGLSDAIKSLKATATATPGSFAALVDGVDNYTDLKTVYDEIVAFVDDTDAATEKSTYELAKKALVEAFGGATDFSLATTIDGSKVSPANAQLIEDYVAAAETYGIDELKLSLNADWGTATTGILAAVEDKITTATDFTPGIDTVYGSGFSGSGNSAELFNNIVDALDALSVSDATNVAKTALTNATANNNLAVNMYKAYDDALTAFTSAASNVDTNSGIMTNTALQAAYEDYVSKADAFGIDDEGILATYSALDFTAVTWSSEYKPAVGTTGSELTNSAAEKFAALDATAQGLVQDVVDTKVALDAIGEYAKFQVSKADYATAEATYNDLVAKRDTAQATVNTLTNSVESTEKEKTRTDMLYNVANAKLDTAKNAVEADDSQALYFQVGANAMQGLEMSIGSVKSDVLGIGDGKGVTNIDVVKDTGLDTTALLDVLDTALSYVTTERSRLGAAQNRLEYTIKSLDISSENLSAAESRIRDTDMAKEMMELTKANTLQQASISMLAQANQAPQSVLQLLG